MRGQSQQHIGKVSGFWVLSAVILLLFAAAIALLVSRSKGFVDRAVQQTTGAPAALAKIDLALKSFAASQKRLPCPANPGDVTGVEAFTGTTATCANPAGVIPWGSLGLTASDALDTWNRKVSYRVFNGATGFTQADGLNATNCNTSTYLSTGVAVTASGGCAQYHETRYVDFLTGKGVFVNDKGTLISGVAYVLISHGASGFGSFGNDSSGTRSGLPNTGSKEYPNTQVPMDNTYWLLDASASTIAPDAASHFDDVVYYKVASELLNDTNLGGRDWGTVSVDKSFSASSVTTGGAVTLTITLSSTVPSPVKLALPLVDAFPANLVVYTTPSASTTCASGTVTASAGATSVALSAGAIIPARVAAVLGSCTITVSVSPTQPVAMGAAAINYSNAIAQYALEVTPNMGAAVPPPSDAAAVRNMSASPTRMLTATPPPPIVTPSAGPGGTISPSAPQAVTLNSTVVFTVTPNSGYTATVGGTCGGSLVGNTYTTNPITTNCTVAATFTAPPPPTGQTFTSSAIAAAGIGTSGGCVSAASNPFTLGSITITAFATYAGPLVSVSSAGIGVATNACSGASLSSNTVSLERLRFDPGSTSFRYLGIQLNSFSNIAPPEKATLNFYNAGGTLLHSTPLTACTTSNFSNFHADAGETFAYVEIVSNIRAVGSNSLFLIGSVQFCSTGPDTSCVPTDIGSTPVECP